MLLHLPSPTHVAGPTRTLLAPHTLLAPPVPRAGRTDAPEAAPFSPSGVLLKAVLIGGAYDMSRSGGLSFSTLQPLLPAPSAYQVGAACRG